MLPWLGALGLAVLIGAVAIHFVRRWLTPADGESGDFTLKQLRDLHAAGDLTDEEFDRAKDTVIGRSTVGEEPPEELET